MIGALVLASVLHQAPKAFVENPPAPAEEGIHFQAALEVGGQALPSGAGANQMDGFGVVLPRLGVKGGDEFEFELGAPLRLRVLDQEPRQLEQDYGGRLRRQDWDERSDFGQILRNLRIGRDDGHVQLRAGAFSTYSLGAGWLVNRYHNRISPDYHPAGGNLVAYLGPTRVELFASDVLAMRLFAAEVRLDLGRVLSDQDTAFDRFLLSVDAAHDFGKGGGTTPALSAASIGFQAGVVKNEKMQLWLQAAAGARADTLIESIPDYGAALGVVVRGQANEAVDLTGRLEARRQGGRFRFGFFGAGYEFSRFSGVGLSEQPLAEEVLPGTFSGYGEFAVSVIPFGGPEDLELTASASGEYYVSTGRVDADAVLQAHLPGGKTMAELRVILTDLTLHPRYSAAVEVRHRFLPAVYGLVTAGREHFPQAEGNLLHGFTAGVGVGVDFQR
ncbi:hypothetical protein [Archangium violaceum]|uniref:Uncharacterized protein n=1 Tax=Archangium violaceum Cb vi76 TaxID=1406225 RepID=A0A084SFS4_9BACT|nr:hypothetical protein [Archangium violaceum]KFA87309.1 hypothetical protein Q664_48585 [Archangium violaceum Cb vi76]